MGRLRKLRNRPKVHKNARFRTPIEPKSNRSSSLHALHPNVR